MRTTCVGHAASSAASFAIEEIAPRLVGIDASAWPMGARVRLSPASLLFVVVLAGLAMICRKTSNRGCRSAE